MWHHNSEFMHLFLAQLLMLQSQKTTAVVVVEAKKKFLSWYPLHIINHNSLYNHLKTILKLYRVFNNHTYLMTSSSSSSLNNLVSMASKHSNSGKRNKSHFKWWSKLGLALKYTRNQMGISVFNERKKMARLKNCTAGKVVYIVVVHNNREETQPIYAAEKKASL